jgi:hypothetical protein
MIPKEHPPKKPAAHSARAEKKQNKAKSDIRYVINPKTGRSIQCGGAVYNRLVAEKVLSGSEGEKANVTNDQNQAPSEEKKEPPVIDTTSEPYPGKQIEQSVTTNFVRMISSTEDLPEPTRCSTNLKVTDREQIEFWTQTLAKDVVTFHSGADAGQCRATIGIWRDGQLLLTVVGVDFETNLAIGAGQRFWIKMRVIHNPDLATITLQHIPEKKAAPTCLAYRRHASGRDRR